MKILKVLLFVILIFPLTLAAAQQNTARSASDTSAEEGLVLSHRLTIHLKPETNELKVTDTITLPDNGQSAFIFRLNSLFHLRYKKRTLHPIRTVDGVSSYHLAVGPGREVVLSYKGEPESTPDCAWLKQSCSLFNESGVFLDGNSHWYPDIAGASHRFSMDITLPENWVSLSQGRQTPKGWQEDNPQRSIYLLAGAFTIYESQPDPTKPKAMVYLQQDDPTLAQRYLAATHQYLEQYSKLLGAYPYAKFATVESFWETGWGMPSFTLLGSRVLRLPFILHSSFPHEILHNWWGNSVYVDAAEGNWSEGLTAYLADHYNKTDEAARISYRRDALQRYQTYTTAGGDFPLRDFRSRHDRTTQAVGYDKSLMLFHMLRKRLGNQQFFAGLKAFYQQYRFRFASFTQLQETFAQHGKQELDDFFQQWREQRGAPRLKVVDYQLLPQTDGAAGTRQLALTLQQTQAASTGQHFIIDIPLKVQDANGQVNHQTLRMDKPQQEYTLSVTSSARRVLIDPYFDVLRIPDAQEVPAALNVLFNRQAKTFLLDSKIPLSANTEAAWRKLFATLSQRTDKLLLQFDAEAIWEADVVVLMGSETSLMPQLTAHGKGAYRFEDNIHTLNDVAYAGEQHALALTLTSDAQQLILLGADDPASIQQLARKLPHYGRYSYFLFGRETDNRVVRGKWPVTESPMVLKLGNGTE